MVKPKRKYDPMARKISDLRAALGETQLEFSKHFHVTRTTIIAWEQFGPPAYGPTLAHVKHIMKNLSRRVRRRSAA